MTLTPIGLSLGIRNPFVNNAPAFTPWRACLTWGRLEATLRLTMKPHRPALILLLLWEFIRFALLFFVMLSVFYPVVLTDRQAPFWLILYGSDQLLVPACLLFLLLRPPLDKGLLNLARLGKILGLFPALLLLARGSLGLGLPPFWAELLPRRIPTLGILAGVLGIDFLSLFLLLSYGRRAGEREEQGSLRDGHETEGGGSPEKS